MFDYKFDNLTVKHWGKYNQIYGIVQRTRVKIRDHEYIEKIRRKKENA
jgi:hypothetical protein